VRAFLFSPDVSNGKKNFTITKQDGTTYLLGIRNIRLKLYTASVGIVLFELENRDYRTLEAVYNINGFGRMTGFSYFGSSLDRYLPSEIKIEYGLFNTSINFKELHNHVCEYYKDHELKHSYKPIEDLLQYDQTAGSNAISVKQIISQPLNNQMHVFCFVYSKDLVSSLQKAAKGRLPKEVYRFMTVDENSGDIDADLEAKIRKAGIHEIFLKQGTFYAVTQHAFVCAVHSEGPPDLLSSLANIFLSQYVEMGIIALAQRAVMLTLSAKASKVANKLTKSGSRSRKDEKRNLRRNLKRLFDVFGEYVEVSNQLILPEITPAELGIQLYEKLLKQLYIPEYKENLDSQLNNMYELASIKHSMDAHNNEQKLNSLILILSVVSAASFGKLMYDSILGSWLSIPEMTFNIIFWPALIIVLIVLIIRYFKKHFKKP
jgi:hypothetical protein